MKKVIIILSTIFLLVKTGFSQGNLQFNRVINLTYSVRLSQTDSTIIDSLVIPVNKVWKIESAGFKKYKMRRNSKFMLDNYILDIEEVGSNFSSSSINIIYNKSNFPIWLSTGKYYLFYDGDNIGPTKPIVSSSISIIEFNIVP